MHLPPRIKILHDQAVCLLGLLCVLCFAMVSGGIATAAEPAPIELSYDLPREAQVSIVITDEDGRIVRELLHAAQREAGEHTEPWDGLDAEGEPVEQGTYSWKLLSTQGLEAEYLLTLGTNAKPRWASWPGNHHGVVSVATDPQGRMFVGTSMGEGTPLVVAQTIDDEDRLWTIPHWLDAWKGPKQLARAGDNLYLLNSNGKIYVYDATTGKRQSMWDLGHSVAGFDRTWEEGLDRVVNLAGDDQQLVGAFLKEDAVRWLEPESGEVLDEVSLPKPWDVDVTSDGRVLVLSDGRIVSLTRKDKQPRVIVDELGDAQELAVDRQTGEMLVWVHGDRKQVLRYARDGELLNTYGKKGGRAPSGQYDPSNFGRVLDLSAAGDGRFLIVEAFQAPRRVALLSREGEVLREWYGGQQYSNHAVADPDDPSIVWMDSDWGELIRAKVDYENKTWRVLGTYQFEGLADGLITNTQHGMGRWRPVKRDGQTYLMRDSLNLQLVRFNEEEDRLEPMAAGRMNIHHYWDEQPRVLKELAKGDKSKDAYVWSDLDGDGDADENEIVFSDWSEWGPGGWNFGPDFNLYFTDATSRREDSMVLRMLPVQRWTAEGVPVYASWEDNQVLGDLPPEISGSGARGRFTYPAEDGSVYATFNFRDGPSYGSGHFGGKVSSNRLVKWNADGDHAWTVGRHAATSDPKPGEMHFFWRVYGTVKNTVAVGDAHRTTGVWTEDGLWVGRLLENLLDTGEDLPDSVSRLMWENFHGSVYERPDTGEVLYFAALPNSTPVFRITGWDAFERQQGSLSVSERQASHIQRRKQERSQRPGLLRVPHMKTEHRMKELDLTRYQKAGVEPIQIRDGDKVVAEVYPTWSRRGLQVLFDVKTDRPWKNAATPQLAFQGGAGVDVKIAGFEDADGPLAEHGFRVVAMPTEDGGAKAVEFLPRLPDGEQVKDRVVQTYKTGNGEITFERVHTFWKNRAAAKVKEDGSGYLVQLRARLDFNTLAPHPGKRLRVDFSVFLANPEGTATELRLPWHSNDPMDAMTADVYFESLLRPDNYGQAVLEE